MNSSDSEDFESADEGLDFDSHPKGKVKAECTKITKKNIEDNKSTVIFSDEKSSNILCKLEQASIKEEPVLSVTEGVFNDQCSLDDASKSSQHDKPEVEGIKIKPGVKKLGSKIKVNNESFKKPIMTYSNINSEYEIEKNTKVETMKLGIKLTSDLITENTSGGLPENSSKTKVENFNENCKDNKGSTGSAAEHSRNIGNIEETNFEAGDGWEVEEEDGFDIPSSLGKTGDVGIQCAQEPINELDQVQFRPSKEEQDDEPPTWGGWGGWGVSSLLSSATGTVTNFSSHVTAGLSTVLETQSLPSSLPSQPTSTDACTQVEEETAKSYSGLGSIVSGVSLLGSTVINRGLDTLETIGKKTMEVLQEGDPGLKKKRAMIFQSQDKPILSQILREAKEKADNSDKEKEEKEAARKVHFESLFDDFQGMVHLEALEMLSTQSELKLQSLLQTYSGTQLLDLQETLSQVRDLCELAEEDEDCEVLTREQFAEKVANCIEGLRIKIKATKIIKVNNEICERLEQLASQSATEVNQAAISSLAEFTAAAMECFHKSAELLLAKYSHNTADEAENYVQLTNHLCARVSAVANEFTQFLTKNHPIANSSLITNIFLEASNSCSYIKNACQLLVPILQVGAISS